ncbi:hypothetical protein Q3G72_020546 [Acer saccharum]|nr:hypothetical protein Q3G72_020546 [Acer saccharum]
MQDKGILPNVITYNALMNGLCKERRIDEAYKFFAEMKEKGILPNKYTYTILISENCNRGNWQEALRLYKELLDREIQPDYCTHSALFKKLDKDYKVHAVQYLESLILDTLLQLPPCKFTWRIQQGETSATYQIKKH